MTKQVSGDIIEESLEKRRRGNGPWKLNSIERKGPVIKLRSNNGRYTKASVSESEGSSD